MIICLLLPSMDAHIRDRGCNLLPENFKKIYNWSSQPDLPRVKKPDMDWVHKPVTVRCLTPPPAKGLEKF